MNDEPAPSTPEPAPSSPAPAPEPAPLGLAPAPAPEPVPLEAPAPKHVEVPRGHHAKRLDRKTGANWKKVASISQGRALARKRKREEHAAETEARREKREAREKALFDANMLYCPTCNARVQFRKLDVGLVCDKCGYNATEGMSRTLTMA